MWTGEPSRPTCSGPNSPIARSLYVNAFTGGAAARAPSVYDPVLNDADYILGDGADTRVQLGALLVALVRAGAKFENGVLVE
jgi:hypothetical protein